MRRVVIFCSILFLLIAVDVVALTFEERIDAQRDIEQQVRAEMDRMAWETQRPFVLHELSAAPASSTQFVVTLDAATVVAFVPAGRVPARTVGFQVKKTISLFDSIVVQ